jgi:hypothetical protein
VAWATLFFLNRDDFPDLAPLNTEAGQRFIDKVIDAVGGVDKRASAAGGGYAGGRAVARDFAGGQRGRWLTAAAPIRLADRLENESVDDLTYGSVFR